MQYKDSVIVVTTSHDRNIAFIFKIYELGKIQESNCHVLSYLKCASCKCQYTPEEINMRVNKKVCIKPLTQCLAHGKHMVLVSKDGKSDISCYRILLHVCFHTNLEMKLMDIYLCVERLGMIKQYRLWHINSNLWCMFCSKSLFINLA